MQAPEQKTITPERLEELAESAMHRHDIAYGLYSQAKSYKGKQGCDGETIFSIEDGIERGLLRREAERLEEEARGLARYAYNLGAPLDEHMVLSDQIYFVLRRREAFGVDSYEFVFEDLPDYGGDNAWMEH